uniref:Uncharacterized protein n=1 Tax=Parascaris equorum TaxID=6256 RepID=A0A914SCR1_PAREQ
MKRLYFSFYHEQADGEGDFLSVVVVISMHISFDNSLQVAYFLGHTNWSVTLCVPKRAKMLDSSSICDEEMRRHIERRNECYRMAFCYLRDMAERRHCEVG